MSFLLKNYYKNLCGTQYFWKKKMTYLNKKLLAPEQLAF